MKRLFVDTNIVIDLLEKRMPFCDAAAKLFSEAYHKRVQLIISPTTYATASYLLARHHSLEEVHNLLANLRQLTSVSTEDERVVDDAIASKFEDFEDALQYYSAIKMNADIIITRNLKDFAQSQIPVMTAEDYLESI